jgi:arsenate reductase (glutaredoxin)
VALPQPSKSDAGRDMARCYTLRAMPKVLVLSYAGCGTCKKALAWLAKHDVEVEVRPIVEEPPSPAELAAWIPRSGKPVRKWLNTSGQSYRALGKEKVDAASDDELAAWLAKDGKLVKRPVVVVGKTVLVGFDEAAFAETFR